MTIRRLGNFSYERLGKIPDDVRALDGMGVRLHGYILPIKQSVAATEFALVPTLGACCYGQPPSVEHIVLVTCASGNHADGGQTNEVIVNGTLHVGEIVREDNVVALYRVTDASVRPMVR